MRNTQWGIRSLPKVTEKGETQPLWGPGSVRVTQQMHFCGGEWWGAGGWSSKSRHTLQMMCLWRGLKLPHPKEKLAQRNSGSPVPAWEPRISRNYIRQRQPPHLPGLGRKRILIKGDRKVDMTKSICTEVAEVSPGMVSVFYFNQAQCIWSFPSECACAFSLSNKCLSRKEAKEKVEKRQRVIENWEWLPGHQTGSFL